MCVLDLGAENEGGQGGGVHTEADVLSERLSGSWLEGTNDKGGLGGFDQTDIGSSQCPLAERFATRSAKSIERMIASRSQRRYLGVLRSVEAAVVRGAELALGRLHRSLRDC